MAANGGRAEIVNDLAAPLPAMMIGKLLGFEEDDWPKLKHWSETTIAMGGGPRYFSEVGMVSAMEFAQAAADVFEAKKGCPADDVLSHYTTAEVDGCPMSTEDVIADSLLLLDGGAETTRTVIARTILELMRQPEELAKLRAGADMTIAVEEFIRWVTPVHNMCCVAVEDALVGDTTIPAGNQVVLMYSSGNRDEKHFDQPERFDVTRNPNNHIAFGFGTHFCMGASLARLEIKVFFEELLRRTSGWQLVPGRSPWPHPTPSSVGSTQPRSSSTSWPDGRHRGPAHPRRGGRLPPHGRPGRAVAALPGPAQRRRLGVVRAGEVVLVQPRPAVPVAARRVRPRDDGPPPRPLQPPPVCS